MLERLMALSLRNRPLVGLVVALIVALGGWAVATLPIDAFPDVTNVQVEVISTAPGLSPLEIERLVTYPIEVGMRGLPGLDQMRSVTKFGISVITLVFRDDIDIYFARQQVFERLASARRSLPDGVETEMGPITTAMGEIYQFTLERPGEREAPGVEELTERRSIEDWVVAPLLKTVRGVTEVNSFGGYIRQYEVAVDPDRLLAFDLSVHAVHEAIARNNVNVGGNVAERGAEQFIIRGVGLIRSEQDIRDVVLASKGGTPILVGDVAEVRLGHALRQGACLKDGEREVVGGIVMMLRGENSRAVVARVEERVREINSNRVLPGGLQIVPFYKRSAIVDRSTRTVLWALAEGSALVALVLVILLRSARGALVVIVALPLSALLTFLVMRAAGIHANLMSLGGLAISIGMIIDATIIQVENVQRHLGRDLDGRARLDTVLRAASEVRKPSIFGEMIIALTFVPILALGGMEGKMFTPLALTVAIALSASLLLSIFVVPALCLMLLRPVGRESLAMTWARRAYRPLLAGALARPRTVVGVAAALVLAALLLVPRLGTEFVPVMDEGAFDMDVQLVPGISLDEALQITRQIQQRLKQFPELETVVSRTGQTGVAIEARSVDKTGFVGALRPQRHWTSARSRHELWDQMREAIADLPGVVASFSQPIQCRIDELVAGTRAQIIVKLFGDDETVLKREAARIAETLRRIDGATDLVVEQVAGQPTLSIHLDRASLARHGLMADEVLEIVEFAVGGKPISRVYLDNRAVDIALRFPEDRRRSIERLGETLIDAPAGYRVTLSQVASLSYGEGPAQISRVDGRRCIGLEVNVTGRDIGGFVAEARSALGREVALPPGYYTEWGGQFENQQQAMRRLSIILPAVVALIFVLLLITFGAVRPAALVLANLPFAMVGGVFALYVSGLYLSVPASVGFIVLFGVAVLNGIVLVSCISQRRAEGIETDQAVASGCDLRLRPVLMTAAIAVFSLLPMIAAAGPGSEVQRPLAVVVVGGLLSSTLLTLFVLPVLYRWLERRGPR